MKNTHHTITPGSGGKGWNSIRLLLSGALLICAPVMMGCSSEAKTSQTNAADGEDEVVSHPYTGKPTLDAFEDGLFSAERTLAGVEGFNFRILNEIHGLSDEIAWAAAKAGIEEIEQSGQAIYTGSEENELPFLVMRLTEDLPGVFRAHLSCFELAKLNRHNEERVCVVQTYTKVVVGGGQSPGQFVGHGVADLLNAFVQRRQ